jgi:hypothetical protein
MTSDNCDTSGTQNSAYPADASSESRVVRGQRRKQPTYICLKAGGLFGFAGPSTQWGESTQERDQS